MTRAFALVAALSLVTPCCAERRPYEEPPPDLVIRVWPEGVTKVDLLLVTANNSSMVEQQAILADQAEILVGELIRPTTTAQRAPTAVSNLHVGVVTSDVGGFPPNPSCDSDERDPLVGMDGVLRNTVSVPQGDCTLGTTYNAADCERESCPWFVHSADHPDDGRDPDDPPLWDAVGCIVIDACGSYSPQTLEASLRALTVQSEPGRPNHGFLRPDSLLAILYYTDEDDCSAADPALFDLERDDLGTLRCFRYDEMMHPVERYLDGLLELRRGAEDLLVVSVIAGIPIDGSWEVGDPLEELYEMKGVEPDNPSEVTKTCDTSLGVATSPARLVELAYALGDNAVISSICRADQTQAMLSVAEAIQAHLGSRCLPSSVPADTASRCRLVETLPDGSPCPHLADSPDADRTSGWQVDLGLDVNGRRRCEVLPGSPGWLLDPGDCERGQLRLEGVVLVDGSETHLECRT